MRIEESAKIFAKISDGEDRIRFKRVFYRQHTPEQNALFDQLVTQLSDQRQSPRPFAPSHRFERQVEFRVR